jgi:DNA-binding NarL/FixJ family response regulator
MTRADASDRRPIRVVLVEDEEMFAQSIARALDRVDDVAVVGIGRTDAKAVAIVAADTPDVAVIDSQLGDTFGTALARRIRDVSPRTQIVLLTARDDSRVLLEAIEAGCAGYLTKEQAIDDLLAAVRSVHAGEAYIPADRLAELLPGLRTRRRPDGSSLTNREREVLQLLSEGKSNDAMATQLRLSKHTIRNHAQSVLTKLGAHSRLEAVAIAVRKGLLERG